MFDITPTAATRFAALTKSRASPIKGEGCAPEVDPSPYAIALPFPAPGRNFLGKRAIAGLEAGPCLTTGYDDG